MNSLLTASSILSFKNSIKKTLISFLFILQRRIGDEDRTHRSKDTGKAPFCLAKCLCFCFCSMGPICVSFVRVACSRDLWDYCLVEMSSSISDLCNSVSGTRTSYAHRSAYTHTHTYTQLRTETCGEIQKDEQRRAQRNTCAHIRIHTVMYTNARRLKCTHVRTDAHIGTHTNKHTYRTHTELTH